MTEGRFKINLMILAFSFMDFISRFCEVKVMRLELDLNKIVDQEGRRQSKCI